MKFSLVISVFTDFLVYKCSDKDYIRKNIKPEHKNDHRSKGTVNRGIFYRKTYEPGEKTAYNGKNKGTENRTGKNGNVIWASPGVAVINRVKHPGGKNIQNYKPKPVPKVCNIQKIYKINKDKKWFKKVDKPSSADNRNSKNIDSNKKSDRVNKAEGKTQSIVAAAAFKNFPKSAGKHSESGSTGDNCRCYTYDKKSA